MKKDITIAFGSVPKDGGTFTFYRTLRPKLLDYGIDLRCVTVGKIEADLWDDSFADDGCVLLCQNVTDIKVQAKTFVNWCKDNSVDIVMAINSIAIQSALPHLPEYIRVMSRLASITDNGLRKTVLCAERLVRIITTAPRHERELLSRYVLEKERILMIPNGITPSLFDSAAQNKRGMGMVVHLGFLGRLEHNDKGVLFLPEIVHHLNDLGTKFKFKIAGKGVYGKALRREFKKYIQEGVVEFLGSLHPTDVPNYLQDVDILVFPSQNEGCPNTLLEAMMAGCATVSSRLEGITDFIIEDERSGFLCSTGDSKAFATRIAELADDRLLLQQMSKTAAEEARERFSQARVAADYAQMIHQAMEEPVIPWVPKFWSEFEIDQAFKAPFWRGAIPDSLKKLINKLLFYLRWSDRYDE